MKLFTTAQIKEIDKYTIVNEPISSINLMERAANQLFRYIIKYINKNEHILVICGQGNNGGDGLALARLLFQNTYKVSVLLFADENNLSSDNQINYKRAKEVGIPIKHTINVEDVILDQYSIIIDALFGSGLNRPLQGEIINLIKKINESHAYVISIDIPSGLMGENNSNNNPDAIIKADLTLTLEFPKISFFFPENEKYVGNFEIVPIFLHNQVKNELKSNLYFLDKEMILSIHQKRSKFIEKRDAGCALLYAGSKYKMGAAILASKAALRSGLGLLTTCIPEDTHMILQTAVPEALLKIYKDKPCFVSEELNYYDAIAVGCAIGVNDSSLEALKQLIQNYSKPIIIDADAITLLSKNKDLLKKLPKFSILTPHIREFDRLLGYHSTHYERFLTAQKAAVENNIFIILKGAYTQIHCPDGTVYFNSTGNPGMATGGSGDVLTGILLGLLAQHYSSTEAALLGVYIHGLAADIALSNQSNESLIASDITNNLGKAFNSLYK